MTEIRQKPPPFALNVYLANDGKTVFGHGTYPAIVVDNKAIWYQIKFGTPIAEAYKEAMHFERRTGVKVQVNDPKGLYPDSARPKV